MIDRNKFIIMCQKASVIRKGEPVPEELKVIYKGIEWKPHYYVMKFSQGEVINVACLKDINANCYDYALLSEIETKQT